MSRFMREMTWREVADLDKENTLVMLPIGSFEQHGLHLPLITDTIHADTMAQKIHQLAGPDFPLLILPTLPYGQSVEHTGFAGTLTLTPQTLLMVLADLCGSLADQGFKKIIVLNGHGGNSGLLSAYSAQLWNTHKSHMFIIDISQMLFDPESPVQLDSPGGQDYHGGELETSLILAAEPALVQMDKARNEVPTKYGGNHYLTLNGPFFMGWSSRDISSIGIAGMATAGTAEKGKQMFDFMAEKSYNALKEILAWEPGPLE